MTSKSEERFKLVFVALEEAGAREYPMDSEVLVEEAGEIAELRRIVLELSEPTGTTFTTT